MAMRQWVYLIMQLLSSGVFRGCYLFMEPGIQSGLQGWCPSFSTRILCSISLSYGKGSMLTAPAKPLESHVLKLFINLSGLC